MSTTVCLCLDWMSTHHECTAVFDKLSKSDSVGWSLCLHFVDILSAFSWYPNLGNRRKRRNYLSRPTQMILIIYWDPHRRHLTCIKTTTPCFLWKPTYRLCLYASLSFSLALRRIVSLEEKHIFYHDFCPYHCISKIDTSDATEWDMASVALWLRSRFSI